MADESLQGPDPQHRLGEEHLTDVAPCLIHPGQPADPLAEAEREPPEPPDRRRQAEPQLRLPGLDRPLHRQAKVVQLRVEPVPPLLLLSTPHLRLGGLGQLHEVPGMTPAHRIGCIGLIQLVPGELADRLQQPIAGVIAADVGGHQRLVDQSRDQFEHLQLVETLPGAHPLRRLEIEAALEHRQPLEQLPFPIVQQPVGPVDGRRQGLLPR